MSFAPFLLFFDKICEFFVQNVNQQPILQFSVHNLCFEVKKAQFLIIFNKFKNFSHENIKFLRIY